jgi:hypothetical protein
VNIKTTGYALLVIGILGAAFSLAADYLGVGKGGISAAQFLGAEMGVTASLVGAALIVVQNHGKIQYQKYTQVFLEFIRRHPVLVCFSAGFLVAYILFFVSPVLLNAKLQFQYLYGYLPSNIQLGLDLRLILKCVEDWITLGQSPSANNGVPYPPLFNVLFAPLLLLGFPGYYFLMTAVSIVSYFFLTLIIPAIIPAKKDFSLLLLFFFTGIFSYGWQFELERGQFNIIVVMLCLLAVYLYHYHEEFRYFAYLFFSIAVQLKIFPLIFIVMFIKDWRNWKDNLRRMVGLCLFNFALLFILGYSIFIDFVNIVFSLIDQGSFWIGNHSIRAFVYNLCIDGLGVFQGSALAWIRQNSGQIEILLLVYFAICFLTIIVISYARNENGFNSYLLLACTIGAMVIPAFSHDYKLAILAAPMSIAFNNIEIAQNYIKRITSFALILLASFAYSVTLYPFKYRPEYLANSMPLLFVILTAAVILYLINKKPVEQKPQEA